VYGGRTLSAEELSRDVEGLAADNNDLLAVQELLGDGAGQATEQVTLSVDDDLYRSILSAIALMTDVGVPRGRFVCASLSPSQVQFQVHLFLCSLRYVAGWV
jgi:hypothetical protein